MTITREFVLLASDPGSKNYGYSVLSVKATAVPLNKKVNQMKKLIVTLLEVGVIKSKLTSLKDVSLAGRELMAYRKELRSIAKRHQTTFQIAERYMSRRMGGVTIEIVNQLIGALRVEAQIIGNPLKLIPSSQWKNELKRRGVDLDIKYKDAKKVKRTPHELDATLIGVYGAFALMRCKPYEVKDPIALVDGLIKKLERLK